MAGFCIVINRKNMTKKNNFIKSSDDYSMKFSCIYETEVKLIHCFFLYIE